MKITNAIASHRIVCKCNPNREIVIEPQIFLPLFWSPAEMKTWKIVTNANRMRYIIHVDSRHTHTWKMLDSMLIKVKRRERALEKNNKCYDCYLVCSHGRFFDMQQVSVHVLGARFSTDMYYVMSQTQYDSGLPSISCAYRIEFLLFNRSFSNDEPANGRLRCKFKWEYRFHHYPIPYLYTKTIHCCTLLLTFEHLQFLAFSLYTKNQTRTTNILFNEY